MLYSCRKYHFNDIKFFSEYSFSIGVEKTMNQPYISVPSLGSVADSREYYRLDKFVLDNHEKYCNQLIKLSKKCYYGLVDHCLFYYEKFCEKDFSKFHKYLFEETESFCQYFHPFSIGIEMSSNKPYIAVLICNCGKQYKKYFLLNEILYFNHKGNECKLKQIAKELASNEYLGKKKLYSQSSTIYCLGLSDI